MKFCLIGHIRPDPDRCGASASAAHRTDSRSPPCAHPSAGCTARRTGPAQLVRAPRTRAVPDSGRRGSISSRYHCSWRTVGPGTGSGTAVMQATGARDGAYAPTQQRIMLRGLPHPVPIGRSSRGRILGSGTHEPPAPGARPHQRQQNPQRRKATSGNVFGLVGC
ncbi:hypothetical protein KPATCC21470_5852 [Kitasatospora purpeofusca]